MKSINEQISTKFVIQAKKLAKYTSLLRNILPMECHNHVQVANIRDQNLMLITDSPVWTTRLRQLSPQILQSICSNTAESEQIIHHIQISTRYHSSNGSEQQILNKKNRHKLQISDKTAMMLSQSADSIEHPQLKSALLKIASHANRKNKTEE
jgi:hypothetical protein